MMKQNKKKIGIADGSSYFRIGFFSRTATSFRNSI